jgi:hypothetical protein
MHNDSTMTYGLPCGNDRCPLCPPQRLADVPESMVVKLPTTEPKHKPSRFTGKRYTRRVGQVRDDFAEDDWHQRLRKQNKILSEKIP